jgi:hypothetical protein
MTWDDIWKGGEEEGGSKREGKREREREREKFSSSLQ